MGAAVRRADRPVPAGARGSPWALLAQADATAGGWSEYLKGLAGRVSEAPVQLGAPVGADRVEVVSGLKAGDVVLAPERAR